MNERFRFEYVDSADYRLHNVNLTVFEGEVLGIVAQSHTGRSGLIELFSGGARPDSGTIWLNGARDDIVSKLDAKKKGIGCLRAKSQLVPNMSVAENIYVNREGSYFRKLHKLSVYNRETLALFEKMGIEGISPSAIALLLADSEKHIVEIVKAVSLRCDLLVLDHITDRYNTGEMKRLVRLIGWLKEQGTTIVFLTNKHTPLLAAADRLCVIRDGTTAAFVGRGDLTKEELYHYMAKVPLSPPQAGNLRLGEVAFAVEDLQTERDSPPVCFSVKQGEVLGILESEWERGMLLGNALAGRIPFTGTVSVGGTPVRLDAPKRARKLGIGLIEENDADGAIIHEMNLVDNITLVLNKSYDHPLGLLNLAIRRYKALEALRELGAGDIIAKYDGLQYLYNVNRADQMKIVIAKWLCASPKVLVMLNPHLGFDEVSLQEFGRMLAVMSAKEIATVLISTNMVGVAPMCDRIISLESLQSQK
ncbi:ATP-binding cassette domain-containing protein [Ruminococcaceae bacterium OttesenSCG-928-D13]|nr:ATP-binding cassette domain-containing protein [Ruminococcaceae bacterium OttesenSCG-928-D13]